MSTSAVRHIFFDFDGTLTSSADSTSALLQAAAIADASTRAAREAELRGLGYKCDRLRKLGFDLGAIKEGGYGVRDLRATAGFAAGELHGVGFGWPALKQGGCTAAELSEAGASLTTLKEIGFCVPELRRMDVAHVGEAHVPRSLVGLRARRSSEPDRCRRGPRVPEREGRE